MESDERLRIDRWLWAARFFKTRALAAEAVAGGKVHVNGERVKPARGVRPGDLLRVVRGREELEAVVVALAQRRGPATQAQALYRETEASALRRAADAERRRLEAAPEQSAPGRPSKRDRRQIVRFTRGD